MACPCAFLTCPTDHQGPRPSVTSTSRLAFDLAPVPSPLPIAAILMPSRHPPGHSTCLLDSHGPRPHPLGPLRNTCGVSLPPGSPCSTVIYTISTLLTHCSFSALPTQVVTRESVGTTRWSQCQRRTRRQLKQACKRWKTELESCKDSIGECTGADKTEVAVQILIGQGEPDESEKLIL